MPNSAPATRPDRTRASFHTWVVNLALGYLVGHSWLAHALAAESVLGWLFPRLALLSTVFMLSLPALGLTWLAGLALPRTRPVAWTVAVVWTAFHALLWFDTRIFDLFRYHVNGMVWNVIATQGLGDSVQIAAGDWVAFGAIGAGALVAQRALFGWRLARVQHRRATSTTHGWVFRARPVWLALAAVVLAEKGLYATADLRQDRSITAVARLFPLYQRLTLKDLAREHFGYDLEERPSVAVSTGGRVLRYPRAPIAAPPDGPRPNVLMVVVDSLRADALAPETAPALSAFAADARRFANHLSAGNSTRAGLFSLLYGLHGVYWHTIYEERRSTVLVDVLLERGYDCQVFSTARMSSPEFRSTAWVRIDEDVQDNLRVGRGKAEGDRECGRRLAAWLDARARRDAPWFAFVLLDSPHQQYAFPREDPPFRPFVERISYLRNDGDLNDDERLRTWNSYRNAVHHADSVVGAILADLESRDVLDETLVLVTGDHGEEFGENGFFGHTSNFTAAQVHVPFLLRGPGVAPGVEERPTLHTDVVPTVLELLGVDPALRPEYSNGGNLLAPESGRDLVLAGWDELALWTDDAIVVVPFEAHGGLSSVYTHDWRLVLDDEPALRAAGASLLRLSRDCARFLR